MFAKYLFGWLDWVVVVGTMVVSLLIGVFYMVKSKNSNEELLVGGRKMQILPVAASIMVTYVSGSTVLGFPAEVYFFGGQIFMVHIAAAISYILSAYIFIPYFYDMKLTSINEYLENRFESKWVRWLASSTFIVQTTVHTAIILFTPSLALEAFLGLPVWLSIIGTGLCGTIYTSAGGLKAVVITDAFQFLLMLAGMVAIVVKGFLSSGGISNAFEIAHENGRLNFIDFTFNPFMRHNFWNCMIGWGFYSIMQPAVHQLQVQRYSSMPSMANARNVPFKLLICVLCLLTGISIFAIYSKCDPLKNGDISKKDQIVPYFVVNELHSIPGMLGLFTACIFSAVLSSVSSSVNSLAAVTWQDFLSKIEYFQNMGVKSQANVSRFIGLLYGLLIMGLAFAAQNLSAVYEASFAAIGAFGGVLAGIFLLALFFPTANYVGANVGLISGLISMCIITIYQWMNKDLNPLPTSVEECPTEFRNLTEAFEEIETTVSSISDFIIQNDTFVGENEWYKKIFQLSYLLNSVLAATITVTVGFGVSLLALVCVKSTRRLPPRKYLHPFAQLIFSPMLKEKEEASSCSIVPAEDFYFTLTKRMDANSSIGKYYSRGGGNFYGLDGGVPNMGYKEDTQM